LGPQPIANLRKLQVGKAFLGCDGLTPERGLMTTNVLIAELGRVMAEVSNEVIVVADSSKIGRIGFAQITSLDSVQCLITDVNADPNLVSHLRSRGIKVEMV
jgi:DeoR/GlpR family transcriptional regulator of sugar metabolism